MPPEIQIQREIDIERLRVRLRGMTDEQLIRFGKAARYMVSPYANHGKPPLHDFVIQLEEARAEWRRRHQRIQTRPTRHREALKWPIEEARINHVLEHSDGTKLQVDFGHDETAQVELWQMIENWKCEGQVPEKPTPRVPLGGRKDSCNLLVLRSWEIATGAPRSQGSKSHYPNNPGQVRLDKIGCK